MEPDTTAVREEIEAFASECQVRGRKPAAIHAQQWY
jgi:hypothetical protein